MSGNDPALARFGSGTLGCDGAAACSTCGDGLVAARVVRVDGAGATVQDRVGDRAQVATDLVPDVRIGDVLLVHAGVALRCLEKAP